MTAVAIYLRGNAASRARQHAEAQAWCAAHYPGADVVLFEDAGGRYPSLARLCADLEAGRLAAVIAADSITLMRPPVDALADRGPLAAWLHGASGGDFSLRDAGDRIAVSMFVTSVTVRNLGGVAP